MLSKVTSALVILLLLFSASFVTNVEAPPVNKQETLSICPHKNGVTLDAPIHIKSPVVAQKPIRTHVLLQLVLCDTTPIEHFEWFSTTGYFNSYKTSGYYQCRLYFHKF